MPTSSVELDGDMNVELRPIAIKRCLTNLVSNALRHGTQGRSCSAMRGRTSVEITVDDDGPGIPPDKYEDVFRPFVRLDELRNVDTGGVGPRPHHRARHGAQPRRRRDAWPPRRWADCA